MNDKPILSEKELEDRLTTPSTALGETLERIDGDLMVLGAGGKMGPTLAIQARRALDRLGSRRRVIAVSRFGDAKSRQSLESAGVETLVCDCLDADAVARLPAVENLLFLAGRKFGTEDDQELTWAANVVLPSIVARHFSGSRIVAFSTGCVYPLVSPESGGSTEKDPVSPIGEYAQSCLGRERVFQYASKVAKTPVCLFRLNYAVELRYGVLHDIACKILADEPVDLRMGHFNCIWQGDASELAIRALETCRSPAEILNVTGPETLSVREVAEAMAAQLGKAVRFSGSEEATAYLSDATKAFELFSRPSVQADTLIRQTVEWLRAGGRSLDKPTGFDIRDGSF